MVANGGRKHKQLQGLNDGNGIWQEDLETMADIVVSYFENMFTGQGETLDDVVASIDQGVTIFQNASLVAPISDEEIKRAIFSLGCNKSPGPDGFNPAFFQDYWDIIGPDICHDCETVRRVDTGGSAKYKHCIAS